MNNKSTMSDNNNLNIIENIKSDDINKYKYPNLLYNIINRNGYRIFSISNKSKELIKKYGIINIQKDFDKYQIKLKGLIKNYNKKKNEYTYSKIRKAATFYRMKNLINIFEKNHELVEIVESILNDIKTIYDLKDWVTITINFLLSLAKGNERDIQEYHCDYNHIDDKSKFKINNNYPFSIIVTLSDYSIFRFICQSHIENFEKKVNEKLLKLEFGQFIIFHPNLIHSGINIYFIIDNIIIFIII